MNTGASLSGALDSIKKELSSTQGKLSKVEGAVKKDQKVSLAVMSSFC